MQETTSQNPSDGAARDEGQENEASRGNSTLESRVERPWEQPPSVDEIKNQMKNDNFSQRKYNQQYQINRKQAIKELLQESVNNTVRVTNEGLLSQFKDGAEGR